jgi:hypothetical protein
MKTAILRTHKPTKSNSFSDAHRGTICWSADNKYYKKNVNKYICI